MARPHLQVSRQQYGDRPAFGTAVARAILIRVAGGELPATLRLHRPGSILACSRQDAASPGFAGAVRAGRERGFEPVVRLAGGRAAVYHERTLACSWATPDRRPAARTEARFDELASLLAGALRTLGVDARVGEVAGEYCPGAWSVNAAGRRKLAGIGQRLIAGGAHRGAVVVVGDGDRVRDVLVPVYEALQLGWDPGTVGSVEDERGATGLALVEGAILRGLAERYELGDWEPDAETIRLAERLEPDHAVAP